MIQLSVSDAVSLVRKNLDELDPNGSIMYQDENGSSADYGDNKSLDEIISRFLPEAINAVQSAAPVHLLDGKAYANSDLDSVSVSTDGVLSFSLSSGSNFLRLVAFRATDSPVVVSDPIPEATPEGRKQLNPHIRGRADRPRLVQLQGQHDGPAFRYYSLSSQITPASSAIAQLSFVQEQTYSSNATAYPIARPLRQNIIDYITARVLETFGDQRAQSYFQRANNF